MLDIPVRLLITKSRLIAQNRGARLGCPIGEFVGCDKRQRRHTGLVMRCAGALLVTPWELHIVYDWPAGTQKAPKIDTPWSESVLS